MEQFKDFDVCRRNKFPLNQTNKFADYIKTNKIDMFLAMSMNKIISNLGLSVINNKKKMIIAIFQISQKIYLVKMLNLKIKI